MFKKHLSILDLFSKKIKTFKMSAFGNDFILFDINDKIIKNYNIEEIFDFIKLNAIKISNREFGIGCDQIIILSDINLITKEKIKNNNIDSFIIFLNSDGSISGACGNGTRCAVAYLAKKLNKNKINLQTLDRVLQSSLVLEQNSSNNPEVKVDMGQVLTQDFQIPISTKYNINQAKDFVSNLIKNSLDVQNYSHDNIFFGNVGNPHCVIDITDINFNNEKLIDIYQKSLESLDNKSNLFTDLLNKFILIGKTIENTLDYFPNRINVEFVQKINNDLAFLIVWERGSGITFSCGTGASATGYYLINKYKTGNTIKIATMGTILHRKICGATDISPLTISIENNSVIMQGGYSFVCEIVNFKY